PCGTGRPHLLRSEGADSKTSRTPESARGARMGLYPRSGGPDATPDHLQTFIRPLSAPPSAPGARHAGPACRTRGPVRTLLREGGLFVRPGDLAPDASLKLLRRLPPHIREISCIARRADPFERPHPHVRTSQHLQQPDQHTLPLDQLAGSELRLPQRSSS